MPRYLFVFLITLTLAGCATPVAYQPSKELDEAVRKEMERYKAATVGVGIIRDGKLVWTRYYGDESPGVAAGAQSLFNTASVNKAVTAETALRLASQGAIDLDEPISRYFVHPDLVADSRHYKLTPRILLTHQAGFLNWPYAYDDGKLAFVHEPGNGTYAYSGIGFRIFARYLEEKMGKTFPQIVDETVFNPLGMKHATNSHDSAAKRSHIVRPVDENGKFVARPEFEQGYWSAADDLYVSVPDYAKFLIAVMNNEDVSKRMAAERVRVQTDMKDSEIWGCGDGLVDPCPSPYGHGIGWFVFGDQRGIVVHHGGNDRSEAAIGYYRPDTRDGGIIFVNSPQGVLLWPRLVDLIDPEAGFQGVFHDVIAKFFSQ